MVPIVYKNKGIYLRVRDCKLGLPVGSPVAQDLGGKAPTDVQRLAKAGATGKFLSNVKRDMQRASQPILGAKARVPKFIAL